jgi:hypothetical protein
MSLVACTSLRTRVVSAMMEFGSDFTRPSPSNGLVLVLFFGSFLLLVITPSYDNLRLRRNIEERYSIDQKRMFNEVNASRHMFCVLLGLMRGFLCG